MVHCCRTRDRQKDIFSGWVTVLCNSPAFPEEHNLCMSVERGMPRPAGLSRECGFCQQDPSLLWEGQFLTYKCGSGDFLQPDTPSPTPFWFSHLQNGNTAPRSGYLCCFSSPVHRAQMEDPHFGTQIPEWQEVHRHRKCLLSLIILSCVRRPEDDLWESALTSHHVASRDCTQMVEPGSKHLLSHLTSP